jgi:hypothetical protein
VLAAMLASWASFCDADATEEPNILLILADDPGYSDVRCYNDESKIPTPQIDRLAREGMRFADAHSPCTVCTPTRCSLMTKLSFAASGNLSTNGSDIMRFMILCARIDGPIRFWAKRIMFAETKMEFFPIDQPPVRTSGLDTKNRN